MKEKIMPSHTKLPKKKPANDAVDNNAPTAQEYNRIVSFIEPLAFLQFKATQYNYLPLAESLQRSVDEIYAMLEAQRFYN
jgi:hypothetical protein